MTVNGDVSDKTNICPVNATEFVDVISDDKIGVSYELESGSVEPLKLTRAYRCFSFGIDAADLDASIDLVAVRGKKYFSFFFFEIVKRKSRTKVGNKVRGRRGMGKRKPYQLH